MRVLAIISQKGGVGKTTLATSLAVAAEADGKRVAIFDLDPQATACFWADTREAAAPAVRDVQHTRIPHLLAAMREAGCDLVVIDSPAVHRDVALAAAEHADFVLIPTRAAVFDLESMKATVKLLAAFGRPAAAVLTFCPPSGPEVPAAQAGIAPLIPVCPVTIGQRKAFERAPQTGQTVQEIEPESKAASEIAALYAYTSMRLEQGR